MNFLSLILSAILVCQVAAHPVSKRLYQPTSPMFSLIAEHDGAVFQAHLVKFDGTDLKLVADEAAFFGRIKANNGYVLNIPSADNSTNSTNSGVPPSTTNVLIDDHDKLTTTVGAATEHFGIEKSLLTYKNSTSFVACGDQSYRGEYSVYFKPGSNFTCPFNSTGYDINLRVQVDATVNYNPNVNI
ncbi:uncharacterized protein PRCAT00005287001 [Priceomyces carsonii]|uniref:uncharacterized protein n=1 Tax=Priceomyces carsonii TaxID=28549 RepID=UPI002EDBA0AA|nr:unnamed protein product [Priceomyces carsonii]